MFDWMRAIKDLPQGPHTFEALYKIMTNIQLQNHREIPSRFNTKTFILYALQEHWVEEHNGEFFLRTTVIH